MFPSITVLGLKETQDDRAVSPLKCVVRKFLTACLSVGSKKKKKKTNALPSNCTLGPYPRGTKMYGHTKTCA